MKLRPSDIYFSKYSINNVFNRRCPHSYKNIGGTLDDLCEGQINVTTIPRISVMYEAGKWFTGDNRRLWVFRQLERLGKCTTIPVYKTSYIPNNNFTTLNGGASVTVRRNPGGVWYLRPSLSANSTASRNLNTSNRQNYTSLSVFRPALSSDILDEKESIPSWFDNGQSYGSLKQSHIFGHVSQKLDDNTNGDHISQCETISTGYIDVRPGEVSIAQIDSLDREVWTNQWVHKLHEQEDMEINDAVVYSETVGVLNPEIQGPRTCTVNETLEVSDRLSCCAEENIDHLSDQSNLTSGYLFVHSDTDNNKADNKYTVTPKLLSDVTGQITLAQIGSLDREVRTKQWVHKLNEQEDMEINDAVNYSEMAGFLNPDIQEPRTCIVNEALEVSDRLSCCAEENIDHLSDQSKLTSGYLFVHSDTGNNKADKAYKVIPKLLSDVIGQITFETEHLLNGQHSVADQISEIRSYIGNVLENTFSKYEAKIQSYEFDIKALKDQHKQMLEAKQKEIEILKRKIKEIDNICQEEIRLVKTRYQILSEVNACGTCVHSLKDPDSIGISHVAANSVNETEGREYE